MVSDASVALPPVVVGKNRASGMLRQEFEYFMDKKGIYTLNFTDFLAG